MTASVQMVCAPFIKKASFFGKLHTSREEFICTGDSDFRGDPDPAKVTDYQGVVGVRLNQKFWEVFTADSDCGSPRFSARQAKKRNFVSAELYFRDGLYGSYKISGVQE